MVIWETGLCCKYYVKKTWWMDDRHSRFSFFSFHLTRCPVQYLNCWNYNGVFASWMRQPKKLLNFALLKLFGWWECSSPGFCFRVQRRRSASCCLAACRACECLLFFFLFLADLLFPFTSLAFHTSVDLILSAFCFSEGAISLNYTWRINIQPYKTWDVFAWIILFSHLVRRIIIGRQCQMPRDVYFPFFFFNLSIGLNCQSLDFLFVGWQNENQKK